MLGNDFTDDILNDIIISTDKDYIDGITLTGGDPFFGLNNKDMYKFVLKFKQLLPEKTIWAWTGFRYEDIMNDLDKRKILEFIDVLVDGKFDINLRNKDLLSKADLKYRGSSNQRVIDVKKSIKSNSIVEIL